MHDQQPLLPFADLNGVSVRSKLITNREQMYKWVMSDIEFDSIWYNKFFKQYELYILNSNLKSIIDLCIYQIDLRFSFKLISFPQINSLV